MRKANALLLASLALSLSGCAMQSATPAPAVTPVPLAAPTAVAANSPIQEETFAAPAAPAHPFGETAISESSAGATAETFGLLTVFFDYDSFVLAPQSRDILDKNARFLRQNPKARIVLAGHSDERGSDTYNIALGEKRAAAVRSYLIELGIDASRLDVVSYGEERPAIAGAGEEAWAKNRRVEFN